MSHNSPLQSHRFVLVYRCEAREIAGAETVWRGWIERVPDSRQRAEGGQTEERIGFHSLDEIPALLARLMDPAQTTARRLGS